MKSLLTCLILVIAIPLEISAYEPPKGITWDMTIEDVDSLLGIDFKPIESGSECILYYQAIDPWKDDPGPIEEKIRKAIKITIPDYDDAKISNLNVQCDKKTGKVIRFSIEFSSYFDAPPYVRQAVITKYGIPDEDDGLSALWRDADGSWVGFFTQNKPGYKYLVEYIRIAYGSPDYDSLAAKEMAAHLQKEAREREQKEAERKRKTMESDF